MKFISGHQKVTLLLGCLYGLSVPLHKDVTLRNVHNLGFGHGTIGFLSRKSQRICTSRFVEILFLFLFFL